MKFTQWLQLAFILLKITGNIDWSWWLVMSPFFLYFILAFIHEIRLEADPLYKLRHQLKKIRW